MTPQKRRYLFAIMLLTVSILAVAPSLTRADQQQQNGTIAIIASGQGNPIDSKSTCGPASLSLTGSVKTEDNNQLKLDGLTGNLQLGSNAYPISNGQGEANKKGTIQINAKSNGNGNHGYELVLHGSLQGNNVNFDSKESKLSSLCFLSLSGQANINVNSGQSSSHTSEGGDGEDHSSTSTSPATVTQTVTQTVGNTTTITEVSNQTVTESLSPPLNVTTTVTQLNNQTITITTTQTVANSTITQTSTTTVANVTITQSATVTVANTTITITTNSTTTAP